MDIELHLRHAQANDALEQMRWHLCARSRLYNTKDCDVHGQCYNTRARTYINTLQDKINSDAAQYCIVYKALLALDPGDSLKWQRVLRPLEESDIRAMKERLESESEGNRVLPWIWRMAGFCGMEDEGEDELEGAYAGLLLAQSVLITCTAMRIEWCQARAQAHPWSKECQLLEEKMRRVIDFFNWHAWWWLQKAEESIWDSALSAVACSAQHNKGCQAYARRQAAIRLAILHHCADSWRCVPEYLRHGAQSEG